MLTSWELVLVKIYARWGLDVCHVTVKPVTLYAHKTICPIDSEVDVQCMCRIHHMFNSVVVDLIVDSDEGVLVVPLGFSFPS